LVRAAAISKLGDYEKPEYVTLFKSAVNDSSYTVAGNALEALSKVDEKASAGLIKQLYGKPLKGTLQSVVMSEVLKSGDESMAEEIIGGFAAMPMSQGKFEALGGLSTYLSAIKDISLVKRGVDEIVKFRDGIPEAYRSQTDGYINSMILKGILAKKQSEAKANNDNKALQELVNYIKEKIPADQLKGF
ncbi:MAG TPA: HEAT repeat domain-containing protein, partial [Chitinophagaceae bacterium]|nr:HEAT repeat domain-containing protein [Chitinophagaceae bacterium]